MSDFLHNKIQNDKELERLYYEEKFILSVTEKLWEILERKGMKKADLAQELGVSRAHVTSLLKGGTNISLRKLASIAYALNLDVPDIVLGEKVGTQEWRDVAFVERRQQRVPRRSPNSCITLATEAQYYGTCQVEMEEAAAA